MCVIAHLKCVTMLFQSLCTNSCQSFDLQKNCQRIVESGEEIVEKIHEKALLAVTM